MQIFAILVLLLCSLWGAAPISAWAQGDAPEAVSTEVLLKRAAKFVEKQDYRFAIGDLTRVLRTDPANVDALAMRGSAWTKLNEPEKGLDDLNRAITLAPSDAALYSLRADALEAAGQASAAKADRDHVNQLVGKGAPAAPVPVTISPADPLVSAPPAEQPSPAAGAATIPAAASPVSEKEPVKKPEAAAAKALLAAAARKEAGVHHLRGRDFIRQGKFGEAVAELDRAIELQPTVAQYYNARGFAFYMLRDTKHALRDLDEAIGLNAAYGNAYLNRSNARRLAGDTAGSAADLAKARELGAKR